MLSALAWLLVAFIQSPGLTSADTKHDLTADPWGFLAQALWPWTDTFPLGQLQNQAYGYLFPHGLFFAVLDWAPDWLAPDWVAQRLWWALLLFLAFAGMVRVLEAWPGRASGVPARVIAGALFALSPRILTNLGAISSEAWVMALAPWALLPVLHALRTRRDVVRHALTSAVVVLCMGAVNAVATAAAVLPAVVFLAAGFFGRGERRAGEQRANERRAALRFSAVWIPAGILACFWWIGPLLLLGRYSPAFTDYIESSSLTTRWLNPLEVLRGTTSWVPFLSSERPAGNALVIEPVFIVATLIVALLGLWGLAAMARAREPFAGRTLVLLLLGFVVMAGAVSPFSPFSEGYRDFLDGAGAALRNLHKFDPLVRIPLIIGVAYALRRVELPTLAELKHPEKNRAAARSIALGLLVTVVAAPAWSGSLAAADPYKNVPGYWQEAADWLNRTSNNSEPAARTMILPEARFGKQTWGNTRDEPAQPLLDVPWVVRDSVPLVDPVAIRALDGIGDAVASGRAIPTLASTLRSQGVGYLLVRSDLTKAADTPGAAQILRTLERSGGFHEAATFGADQQIRIFTTGTEEQIAAAGLPRIAEKNSLEAVLAGPEALPRLAEADAALGRDPHKEIRPRVTTENWAQGIQTITDTPGLRDHNYGNVVGADSAIRAPGDDTEILNPVRDYPAGGLPRTHVTERGGQVRASSTADGPTNFGGAETTSSLTAAVDKQRATAWRPAPGVASGQWLEFDLDQPVPRLGLDILGQTAQARLQITTYLGERTVASTTDIVGAESKSISVPAGQADRVRITILNSFGDFGVAEATVTDASGKDITPRRIVSVPAGEANRWLFGQEIPEGVMTRSFETPRDLPLVVHTSRCGGRDEVTIDGQGYRCGSTLQLPAGRHTLSSAAEWASLTIAEPLLASAISDAPAPLPLSSTSQSEPGAVSVQVEASSEERVLWLPSQANRGRVADGAAESGSEQLAPLVVNGWQQGWIVPAGFSGTINVHFSGTSTYRTWLLVGLGAAVLLVALWAVSVWIGTAWMSRRGPAAPTAAVTPAPLTPAPVTPAPVTPAPLWQRITFGTSSAVTIIGAAQGPWGTEWYAGDSWPIAIAATIALAVPYVALVLPRPKPAES